MDKFGRCWSLVNVLTYTKGLFAKKIKRCKLPMAMPKWLQMLLWRIEDIYVHHDIQEFLIDLSLRSLLKTNRNITSYMSWSLSFSGLQHNDEALSSNHSPHRNHSSVCDYKTYGAYFIWRESIGRRRLEVASMGTVVKFLNSTDGRLHRITGFKKPGWRKLCNMPIPYHPMEPRVPAY